MAQVALTAIRYGREDGSIVVFAEGDDVKSSDFPKDVLEDLKAQGAVGTPPRPREEDASAAELQDERDSLAKRVEDLEAQLAEAKAAKGSNPPPKDPPKTPPAK